MNGISVFNHADPCLAGRDAAKTKDITVRQAMDIITVAGNLIGWAWHKEEERVKF